MKAKQETEELKSWNNNHTTANKNQTHPNSYRDGRLFKPLVVIEKYEKIID